MSSEGKSIINFKQVEILSFLAKDSEQNFWFNQSVIRLCLTLHADFDGDLSAFVLHINALYYLSKCPGAHNFLNKVSVAELLARMDDVVAIFGADVKVRFNPKTSDSVDLITLADLRTFERCQLAFILADCLCWGHTMIGRVSWART